MYHLIYDGWFQIYEDRPRDVLPTGRLGEENVEAVVRYADRIVVRDGAVRVDPVLQAVKLPENPQCEKILENVK